MRQDKVGGLQRTEAQVLAAVAWDLEAFEVAEVADGMAGVKRRWRELVVVCDSDEEAE